jgi:two-component system NtrC family response regulator
MAIMQTHSWPGNVRELRNVLERAMLLAGGGRLTLADLPAEIRQPPARNGAGEGETLIRLGPEGIDLELVERQLVEQALKRTGGNQTRAAALLNMTRDQLRYRVQKYGLKPQGD